MSKGNMFLGQARGKVGDLVFYRMDGQQMTRTRNRAPRNPRTPAQLYQRAIMASVTAAYSAGSAIFDHSFQGLSVGAENQRRFLSINARALRAAISADIENQSQAADQLGRVCAPSVRVPVPFTFQVSEGDYPQLVFGTDGKWDAPASGVTTLGAYAAQLGLIKDDYYTFVGFFSRVSAEPLYIVESGADDYGTVYPGGFVYLRMKVKDSIIGSTDALPGSIKLTTLFEFDAWEGVSRPDMANVGPTDGVDIGTLTGMYEADAGGIAIIRSRFDQDLRSTSSIVLDSKQFGLVSGYALQAWEYGTTRLGNSPLILEGGGF